MYFSDQTNKKADERVLVEMSSCDLSILMDDAYDVLFNLQKLKVSSVCYSCTDTKAHKVALSQTSTQTTESQCAIS